MKHSVAPTDEASVLAECCEVYGYLRSEEEHGNPLVSNAVHRIGPVPHEQG